MHSQRNPLGRKCVMSGLRKIWILEFRLGDRPLGHDRRGGRAQVERMRDYNLKMIDRPQANTVGVFEFARQLSTAKSSSDLVELWTTHAKKQTAMLNEQIRACSTQTEIRWGKHCVDRAQPHPGFQESFFRERESDGDAHNLSKRCESMRLKFAIASRGSIAWPRRTTSAETKGLASIKRGQEHILAL